MGSRIPAFLLKDESFEILPDVSGKTRFSSIDLTITKAAKSIKTLYLQAESAGRSNLICDLNPVTKVISFVYMVVIISLANSLVSQILLACSVFVLFLLSGIRMFHVYQRILLIAFLFGFLVSAPAALNVITPGEMVIHIVTMQKPHDFWIYQVPAEIGITIEGCRIVIRLFLRVFNSVSLTLLLVYSSSFPRLLKAFGVFHIPDTLLMVVWLAYKFIFILCRTIEDTFLAVKSRFISNVKNKALRKIVAGRMFFIFGKAHLTYEQTYSAMISRGYEGRIILAAENKLIATDFLILICIAIAGVAFLFI
jgi:cobalt/nickel transport system permease protein